MNKKFGFLLSGLALCFLTTACSNDNQQQTSTPAPAAPVQQTEATAPSPSGAGQNISGKVLETLNASGYTYLNLDQNGKQTWVAIPQSNVAVGDEVSVVFSMAMQNFESKTLGRTFDEIVFASGFAPGSQPGSATPPAAGEGSSSFSEALQTAGAAGGAAAPGGSGKAIVPFSELQVEKATGENAYSVGEIFEKKAELSGKSVMLRGKVVKVSKNIMGKNWIHLQDGTGNPMQNTHDLVVTSANVPEMDSIVTISGTLETDKDFGAGYIYSVIMEDVAVQ